MRLPEPEGTGKGQNLESEWLHWVSCVGECK